LFGVLLAAAVAGRCRKVYKLKPGDDITIEDNYDDKKSTKRCAYIIRSQTEDAFINIQCQQFNFTDNRRKQCWMNFLKVRERGVEGVDWGRFCDTTGQPHLSVYNKDVTLQVKGTKFTYKCNINVTDTVDGSELGDGYKHECFIDNTACHM